MTGRVKGRPAESGTLGLALVVGVLVKLTGWKLDQDEVTALVVALGCIPAGITFLVARGGLIPFCRRSVRTVLWGRRP